MFYWLYSELGINIFHYITVRALLGFFIGFAITMIAMPVFIRWAKNKKMRQPIYKFAPKTHEGKKNTPTMGGLVFMSAIVLSTLLCANISESLIQIALFLIVTFSAIGYTDDIKKITGEQNDSGLSARAKLYLQIGFSVAIGALLIFYANMSTDFYVPFLKKPLFDMSYFAIIFWALVIVASSNAVNLTDGLDGLATVPSVFAFVSLGAILYITGNSVLASYLFLPKAAGAGELMIIAFCGVGALLGFLWHNANPAEIFMGDTGSLSLGALMGFFAIVGKSEILLLLIGFIFVLETGSVIIQIASFKSRGKKVFLMTPLHHHFEMKRWAENKIIVRFWIIAFLSNVIALLTLKLR